MITLKTLPQATTQEVFDQVAVHLLTQGQKSMDHSCCVYRGPGGLKCAAGCLISDEEYEKFKVDGEQIENATWNALTSRELVPRNHKSLIRDLQKLHDGVEPEEWYHALIAFSQDQNLHHTAIKAFGPVT